MSADSHRTLSIIIPVYNAEETLKRTLDSLAVIEQAHRDSVEVIAVDDGSTDDSSTILYERSRQGHGFRWQVLSQSNSGVSSARNRALAAASGEWILLLDADDELLASPIPQLTAASHESTSIICASEIQSPGRHRRIHRPANLTRDNGSATLTASNPLCTSEILFRRALINADFAIDLPFGEDWLFWIENVSIFERVEYLPHIVIARIHIHGQNASSQYERAGRFRAEIARRVRKEHANRLSRTASNNLHLQEAIGAIQQGKMPRLRDCLRVPCSARLFAKLCIYAGARLFGLRATPY